MLFTKKWKKKFKEEVVEEILSRLKEELLGFSRDQTVNINVTKVKEKLSKSLMKECEEIYKAYPRHVGKPKALKGIAKALRDIDKKVLLKKTELFALSVSDVEKKFIPHPATWYNQERYNDEIEFDF